MKSICNEFLAVWALLCGEIQSTNCAPLGMTDRLRLLRYKPNPGGGGRGGEANTEGAEASCLTMRRARRDTLQNRKKRLNK
jgi:hypothetical protein